jgi:hypothetical protein
MFVTDVHFTALSNVFGEGQMPTLEWSTLKMLHLAKLQPCL